MLDLEARIRDRQRMLQQQCAATNLAMAISRQHASEAQQILTNAVACGGIDWTWRGSDGITLLTHMIDSFQIMYDGAMDLLNDMFKHGAASLVNVPDSKGQTPLMWISKIAEIHSLNERRAKPLIDVLLTHGADPLPVLMGMSHRCARLSDHVRFLNPPAMVSATRSTISVHSWDDC
jgi:hypothetical protein